MEQIKQILNGPFSLESEDGIHFTIVNNDGKSVGWFVGNLLAGFVLTLLNGACSDEDE